MFALDVVEQTLAEEFPASRCTWARLTPIMRGTLLRHIPAVNRAREQGLGDDASCHCHRCGKRNGPHLGYSTGGGRLDGDRG